MSGLREQVAHGLARCGVVRVVDSLRPRWRRDLRVLAYHRVLPRQDEESFAYDLDLVSAWADEFDWQLGYLAQHYDVITCQELARRLDAGRELSGRELIITFDDGYRDNHSVALPLLQRHGLPAVVFVATGYVGSAATYWYDALVHAVLQSPVEQLTQRVPEPLVLGATPPLRHAAATQLLRLLKRLSDADRQATLASWHAELQVPADLSTLGSPHGPMGWDEVRALQAGGVEIGSHSVSHPILSRVADSAQLRHELLASKQAIEQQTGQPVVSLAYPVGGRNAYSDEVVAIVKEAGYRFAFTYEVGTNLPATWDAWRLDRLRVERYVSRQRFVAALALPRWFA